MKLFRKHTHHTIARTSDHQSKSYSQPITASSIHPNVPSQLRCELSPFVFDLNDQYSFWIPNTHTTYNPIGAAAQREWYDEEDEKEEEDKRKKENYKKRVIYDDAVMHIGEDLFKLFEENWNGICERGDAYE